MKPHNLEETAMTGSGQSTEPEQTAAHADTTGGRTASGTDVTVVRDPSSDATVDDIPAPPTPAEPANFGKYELIGEIARGGMGVVYRARQHGLDRVVALKMILGQGADGEGAQRFLQEARAAAAIDHPNVVPIYDIGEIGSKPYFTMAFVDGPNLRAFVETRGIPSIATTVSLFAQIVAGVAYAHKLGIIHRDLKPANVLIDRDGRPRVTDFGLAKRTEVDTNLTATGQVVGTPQYMAPEQARDSKDVGPPADVYALGAILYFMLTGRPPFHGESFTDLLIKVVSEPPNPPRLSQPDVPEDLEALCLKCLAKTPRERFANADELAAALATIGERFMGPSAIFTPSRGSVGSIPAIGSNPSVKGVPGLSATSTSASAFPNSASPPPDERKNRTPLLVGLVALAVLLVGVIVFLAIRDKDKGGEVAKNDPDATNPQLVKPGETPKPNPSDGGKVAWPAANRKEFALSVKMDPDPKGGPLQPGQPVYVHLTADRDCYVSVWVLDADGATLLFPNEDESDGLLKADETRMVPRKGTGTISTTPTVGEVDRLRVIAKTGKPAAFSGGKRMGPFLRYEGDKEKETVATQIRGLVYQPADAKPETSPRVSEVEIPFRVGN